MSYTSLEQFHTAIADAIRAKKGTTEDIIVKNLPEAVASIPTDGGEWTRPSSWPNLDSITIADNETVAYLTLDNTGDSFPMAFTGRTGTFTEIERGHLENGVFVKDGDMSSYVTSFGNCVIPSVPKEWGDFVLFKLKIGDIPQGYGLGLNNVPSTVSGTAGNVALFYVPIVEARVHLAIQRGIGNGLWGLYTQRVRFETSGDVEWQMLRTLNTLYSLRSLEMSVTFSSTYNLLVGDLYNLDTLDLRNCTFAETKMPILQCYTKIRYFYPPSEIPTSFSADRMLWLDHESLLRILNALKDGVSGQTLTLGDLKGKLTADEIAIATAKGWTVS